MASTARLPIPIFDYKVRQFMKKAGLKQSLDAIRRQYTVVSQHLKHFLAQLTDGKTSIHA